MPILTSIVAAVSAFWATTVIGTITIGQILTGVVLLGLSAVQTYMQQMAAKKAKRGLSGIADPGFQGTTRGAVVPQRTIYGRALAGTAVFFEKVAAPYYMVGGLVAAHEIDGVEQVRINDIAVTLDAAGNVMTAPFFNNGRSLAKVSIRLGTADQEVDPLILARFPGVGVGFRQRGHATVVLEANYGANRDEFDKVWSGSLPVVTVRVRGKKVYDAAVSSQDPDIPSTWTWSSSPTLCAADFIRADVGGRLASTKFRWPRLAAASLIDRQLVPTRYDGWKQRYSADGIIDTSTSAVDSLRALLAANRGAISWAGEGYAIDAGWPKQSVFTIHAGLIVGAIEYRADIPRSELMNVVRTRFVAPDREYQVVDGPVYIRDDLIASDGARYDATLDLIMVEESSRAQRLAKAFFEDGRRGRSLKLTLDIAAIGLEAGDWVTVDLPELMTDALNGLYEVQLTGMTEAFSAVTVTLVETSPDILAFDPAIDEQPFTVAE